MAEQIETAFGRKYKNISLLYSRETVPRDTGGAIQNAMQLILTDPFLVMNGDSFVDADLLAFQRWFAAKKCDAALLLARVENASRYGTVHLDEAGQVVSFEEKAAGSDKRGWINAGVYLLKKKIFTTGNFPDRFSLERELFPQLAGVALYGFCAEGDFIDIGVPESYAASQEFFASHGKLPGK